MRTAHQAYDPATGPAQAFPAGTGQGGRFFAALGQPRRLRILGAACSAAAVAGWLVLGTGPATAAPRTALAAVADVAGAAACGSGGFTLNAQAGDSQVTLSWCEPSPDPSNPSTLAGYSVTDGTSPGGESALTSVDSGTTSYTVQGLTNGTTYYFRVEAVPETPVPVTSSPSTSSPSSTPIARTLLIPSGIWTNEVQATPQAPALRPAAPSGLRASPGDSQVTLSWTAPAVGAGSPPVTGYSVYLGRSPGGESGSPVTQVAGNTATITHLTNGVLYYFVVAADSAAGASDSSSEISAVPRAATSHRTHRGGPGGGRRHHTHSAPPASSTVWGILGAGGLLVAVVLILVTRWLRGRSRSRSVREPAVQVKPAAGPPAQVAIHTADSQPAITVRIDPDAGTRSMLVEEVRS
jgi:hypothetical protein